MRRIDGETRIIRRFLILPRNIKGESRWLERATIVQKWMTYVTMNGGMWYDVAWADTSTAQPADVPPNVRA